MRCLIAFFILLFPGLASGQSIFDQLHGGTFGAPFVKERSCATNPKRIEFSPDHRSMTVRYERDAKLFDGSTSSTVDYEVLGSDSTSLTMRILGETRLTETGETAVWVLRYNAQGDGYCWHRTDWNPWVCTHWHVRCPQPEGAS